MRRIAPFALALVAASALSLNQAHAEARDCQPDRCSPVIAASGFSAVHYRHHYRPYHWYHHNGRHWRHRYWW